MITNKITFVKNLTEVGFLGKKPILGSDFLQKGSIFGPFLTPGGALSIGSFGSDVDSFSYTSPTRKGRFRSGKWAPRDPPKWGRPRFGSFAILLIPQGPFLAHF